MTTEEKAKAYDEAIKRARDVYTYYCDDREQLRKIESIFPELKKSEGERIRKELLQIAKESEDSFYMVMTPDKRKHLIAWLEKQGEHGPVWSKKDEHWRQKAIDFMKHPDLIKATPTLAKHIIAWLKSLRPQNKWTPSDEQMDALAKNVEYVNISCTQPILKGLLKDLKKLREEQK